MSTAAATSTNILGPLTTTFTQSSACTILFNAGSDTAFRDQACNGDKVSGDMNCWPTPTPGANTSPQALSTWGVYSPGLVCPSGHTTACSFDGPASTGDYQFYYPPDSSETAVGCCPSGYFCQSGPHCVLTGSRPRHTSATLVAAAWALVLSSLTERRDVIFGQVVAGRNARLPHIHEVCGPTSTILPLRVRLGAEWVAGDLLRHVQEQSTGVGEFDAPLGLWREVFGQLRSDNGGLVVDTTPGGGYVFPFEIVLLHQSNIEEEQLVCPFGRGTVARPNLLEEGRAPPYICIKSKLGTDATESANTTMDSTATGWHSHRNVRQRELLLSIEAPSTKMDAQTAVWLLKMLADAVSALSGESEMKLAEIKSRLGSR